MVTKFIVRVSAANMPSSLKYGRNRYKNLAVLEVPEQIEERDVTIDARRHNVIRIVAATKRVCVGDTPRSDGYRILQEYRELAAELNARRPASGRDADAAAEIGALL